MKVFFSVPNETEIRYSCSYYGREGGKTLAQQVKRGNSEALQKMAQDLSRLIVAKSFLIPIPNRRGYADFTLKLANIISSMNPNAKTANILRGRKRQSLYELKERGEKVKDTFFDFFINGDIPKGEIFLLDNVFATGTTARAAITIIPTAKILVHSLVERKGGE